MMTTADLIGFFILGVGVVASVGFLLLRLVTWDCRCQFLHKHRRQTPQSKQMRKQHDRLELTNVAFFTRPTDDALGGIAPARQKDARRIPRDQPDVLKTHRQDSAARRAKSERKAARSEVIDYMIARRANRSHSGRNEQRNDLPVYKTDVEVQQPTFLAVPGLSGEPWRYRDTSSIGEDTISALEETKKVHFVDEENEPPEITVEEINEFDAGAFGEESEEFFRGADEIVVSGGFDDDMGLD